MHRCIDESDPTQLIMTSTHRDLNTLVETVATSWFTLNKDLVVPPVPTPNPDVKETEVHDEASDTEGESDEEEEEEEGPEEEEEEEKEEQDPAGVDLHQQNLSHRAMSTMLRHDFSGTWKRGNTENFEAFVGAQGAGYVQRKLAASMQLTHIITMDGPPYNAQIRLQEKGGSLSKLCRMWPLIINFVISLCYVRVACFVWL